MIVANPQVATRLYTMGGLLVRPEVINIGDWNMDTTQLKAIAHGLGSAFVNVRNIRCMIRNDNGAACYPINLFTDTIDPELINGGVVSIDSANITLGRREGGKYDNNSFDSTSYNRGWIFYWLLI